MRFRTIELARDPECRACGTREITALVDYDAFCGVPVERAPAVRESGAQGDDADEITPRALAERVRRGDAPALLDVREPYEWDIAHLAHARLVPLDTVPDALASLDPGAEVVVYCHHGMRSAAAAGWLREQGFTRVKNLVGGIDRWSVEVDPALRRY
jgi:adenylyltransferase/sulfurtransferase